MLCPKNLGYYIDCYTSPPRPVVIVQDIDTAAMHGDNRHAIIGNRNNDNNGYNTDDHRLNRVISPDTSTASSYNTISSSLIMHRSAAEAVCCT